jgi:hypothetical protein
VPGLVRPAERHTEERRTAVEAVPHIVQQEGLHTAVLKEGHLAEGRGRRTVAQAEGQEEVHARRMELLQVRRTVQQVGLHTAEMKVLRMPSDVVEPEVAQQELRTRSGGADRTPAAAGAGHTEAVRSPAAAAGHIPAGVLRTAEVAAARIRRRLRTEAVAGRTVAVEADCSRTWYVDECPYM